MRGFSLVQYQHDLFFSPVVLWWSLGSFHLDLWIWTGQSASFIVRTDVVRAVKIILCVFRLRIFFLSWKTAVKREAESHNQLLWDRLQVPCVQLLAASSVTCSSGSQLYPCGSWTLQGWRSSPGTLVSTLYSVKFLSYIQMESILSVYALSWGSHLSSVITLQAGRARLLWDPPEAVLYSGCSNPAPSALLTGQVLQPWPT